MAVHEDLRAAAPRPPAPSRALERAIAEQAEHRKRSAALQRASVARGVLLVVLIVLVFSFTRAGWRNVFLPGWWRHW